MANRYQLDSSQHHHVATTRNTYFQHKTLLLTLAFVSLLLSIQCASFGHRSMNQQHQQQWHNQPDYQAYSEMKDGANLDGLLNYQPYPGKQSAIELNYIEQSPTRNSYFALPSTSKDLLHSNSASSIATSDEIDQLYRQLLAEQLLKDQLGSQAPRVPSASSAGLLDTYLAANPAAGDSTSPSNSDAELLSDYNAKLVDQLLHDEKKLASLGSQNNYDLKYDNPKNPLYFLPDQSATNEDQNDKISLSIQDDKEGGQDGKFVTYNLSIKDDESPEVNEIVDANDSANGKNDQRNLTTLLEDEPTTSDLKSQVENGAPNSTATTIPTPEATKAEHAKAITLEESTTLGPASYGSVVTAGPGSEIHDKSSISSMFNRFYEKLASYLPNFMSGTGETSKMIVTHKGDKNHTKGSTIVFKSTGDQDEAGSGYDDNDNSNSTSDNDDKLTKAASVAASAKTTMIKTVSNDDSDKATVALSTPSSSNPMADANTPNEDLESAKMGFWNLKGGLSTDSDSHDDANKKRLVEISSGDTLSSSLPVLNVDSASKDSSRLQGGKGHKVSLLRQSSLVLPIKSNDELIIESDSGVTHSDSLLGKYIYAPEHHYHLNTLAATHQPLNSKRVDIDDEQQMYTQMSQRSYLRHLHPGDSIYSSYSGFNPLYDSQGLAHQASLNGNKTNDVYFLAMVGSFCAMAMAVVLAAGLFAYRVQQNRKAATETDYPTYGVVGPNSMNGKCGAASFVGGYFGSAGGLGSSSTCGSSKTGSVKQLADLYCGDGAMVNGIGAGGNNKTKKASSEQNNTANQGNFMANQNAARMYHYQHQKQQMIISDRTPTGGHASASDLDSEDENDDGTYTVYECPGLASAHEMEIKNPLFNDDQSP